MKCLRTLGVLSVTLALVCSMTLETTSSRSTSLEPTTITTANISNNQILEKNHTTTLNILDVRTPPKIQSQIKEKLSNKHAIETSHAGVAIPIEEDLELLEESTKKMNFYKLERPTTTTSNGGLSTWILLSGQTAPTSPKTTTKKSSVKPIIMKDEKNNETLMLSDKPMKIVKPAFKPRSTTARPVTTTKNSNVNKTTTVRVNTFSPSTKSTTKKPTKLTKIKASLLQKIKQNSTVVSTTPKVTITTIKLATSSQLVNITSASNSSSVALPAEAKDGEQELPAAEDKKKKIQKRKKNKNKRRKPDKASKEGNNKLKEIESPGTQLYSYLRSEILPVTVGVSLVGLLVTAGLASYYLQPFAALRRSDPIDRKDDGGNYYYHENYSNAMPEEEAIGKVIAGMPENTLQQANNQPTSRQKVRYRQVDRRSQIHMNPYGLVEDVKLTADDKQFVVGNVPQEPTIQEATPAVVPEHGPRNLKEQKFVVGNIPKEFFTPGASPRNLKLRRRRRQITTNEEENEIDSDLLSKATTTEAETTTTEAVKETTPHNIFLPNERASTLFELITDLFRLKMKLGLELLQNVTNSVSIYAQKVRTRLDQHYRKATKGNRSIYHPTT